MKNKIIKILITMLIFLSPPLLAQEIDIDHFIYIDESLNFHITVEYKSDQKPYKIEELGIWLSAEETIKILRKYYEKYKDSDYTPNIEILYLNKAWDEAFEPQLKKLAKKHGFFIVANSIQNSIPHSIIEKGLSERLKELYNENELITTQSSGLFPPQNSGRKSR